MLPLDREKLARENAELYARSGRAASEAALLALAEANPTVDCAACGRRGTFTVHADGTRDHAVPSAEAGDRVAECGACRGWGFVRVSPATKEHLEREKLRAQRAAYREIRSLVCSAMGYGTTETFDRLVRKRTGVLPGRAPSPEAWLSAARSFAAHLGVEVPA